MIEEDVGMAFMLLGLINGLFAMLTGSLLFGGIGLFFGIGGWYIVLR